MKDHINREVMTHLLNSDGGCSIAYLRASCGDGAPEALEDLQRFGAVFRQSGRYFATDAARRGEVPLISEDEARIILSRDLAFELTELTIWGSGAAIGWWLLSRLVA